MALNPESGGFKRFFFQFSEGMDFSSFSEAEIISLSDLNRTLFIRIKTDFGKVIRKIDEKEKLGKKLMRENGRIER